LLSLLTAQIFRSPAAGWFGLVLQNAFENLEAALQKILEQVTLQEPAQD
jgi:hypothetical protein